MLQKNSKAKKEKKRLPALVVSMKSHVLAVRLLIARDLGTDVGGLLSFSLIFHEGHGFRGTWESECGNHAVKKAPALNFPRKTRYTI